MGQKYVSFFLFLSLLSLQHSVYANPSPSSQGEFLQKTSQKATITKALQIPPLTQTCYIVGGVTGSVLGFGIGHGIVGEYNSMGWVFTMSQVLSLAIPLLAALTMAIIYWDGSAAGTIDHLITTWANFLWVGVALWAAFRVWEIVDLWVRPHHRLSANNNTSSTTQPIVAPMPSKAAFAIIPTILPQGGVGIDVVGQW
ncbi:hypothetical protein L6R29_07960 [Myxococcota bacterium]|nr:hypothetical protein [Myxococcota bacterium]